MLNYIRNLVLRLLAWLHARLQPAPQAPSLPPFSPWAIVAVLAVCQQSTVSREPRELLLRKVLSPGVRERAIQSLAHHPQAADDEIVAFFQNAPEPGIDEVFGSSQIPHPYAADVRAGLHTVLMLLNSSIL